MIVPVLIFSPFNALTQGEMEVDKDGVRLEEGKPYERIRTRSGVAFHRFGEEVLSVKFSKNFYTVHVQKYSLAELKEIDRKEVSAPDRKVTPEAAFFSEKKGGRFSIFYSWRKKEFLGKDQEFLYYRNINRKSLSYTDTIRVFSIKKEYELDSKKGICGFLCFTNADKYDIYGSNNDSILLGTFQLEDEVGSEPEDSAFIRFFMLDNDYDIIWEGKGTMPYKKERLNYYGFLVGEDKDFFAIGEVDRGEEGSEGSGHFEILKFLPDKGIFTGEPIKTGEKTIHSMTIRQTAPDRYLCTGTYKKSEETEYVKGFSPSFLMRI